MHIVGIIGPYISGGNRRLIDHNIADAQYVMIAIANYFAESRLVGFFAPHSHTARFERLAQSPEPHYHTLDDTIYDLACAGFVLLPNWKNSSGARRDRDRAIHQGKPIFELKSYEYQDISTLLSALEIWAHSISSGSA